MAILGRTFEDAARFFGWGELFNFSKHLPETSAVFRARNKDAADYLSRLNQSAMIADLIDSVSALCYMYAKAHNGRPRKPKPYRRPWLKNTSKSIGSDPIPISEFNKWYYGGDS